MIFVDSNIWCFYFNKDCSEHEAASKFLEKIMQKEEIASNTVVIMEVSHFLVKNLGPIEGKNKLDILLSFPLNVSDFDFETMRTSIDMLCKYSHNGIGGRDASILSTMKRKGMKKIVTHDDSFKNVDFIEVVDPIEK